ncbi:MAG TPA: metalloendopeptidase [Faecalibacterium sp.]|nr:metalloendopeptidase [Faecalibacterium sp.]
MLEDKTTETRQDVPTAAPQHSSFRARLRSRWAQFQCVRLLRRHRRFRLRRHRLDSAAKKLGASPLAARIGAVLYALGFGAEYAAVRAGRGVKHLALLGVRGICRFAKDLTETAFPGAAQVVKDLFGPFVLLVKGIVALLIHAHHIHREKGLGAALKASARYFASGVRRNLRLLPRMAMYILPVCALALGSMVFEYVINQPYALAVQVNGETVGYVANEDVFDTAREDVMERISYAGSDKTELTIEPSYTIAVAHHMLDENEMADAIIQSAGDQIGEGTALYLDGELTAVCSDGDALRAYFTSRLEPYEVPDDPNVSVGFNKQVTLEDGLYFKDSLQDYADVEKELSDVKQAQKVYTVKTGDTLWDIAHKNDLTFRELCALNTNFKGEPLNEKSSIREGDELIVTKEEAALEVRITRIETREEEVAFAIETTKSNEYTKGTTKVLQEGQNGLRRVTFQNVYDTNNVLVEQTILSTEVIKEPVNKKVVQGTKKVKSSTKFITGSGQFIWPVPNYRYCSRWYGGRHRGVDICAPAGTPIYASAGGTVTKAGYNKAGAGTGYGYSVIINHGGGYSTVYAHCLSLTVSAGQTVKQGQLIGYLGSTGRSTGNHCHFEIRLNGSYIPPQNVFPGRK